MTHTTTRVFWGYPVNEDGILKGEPVKVMSGSPAEIIVKARGGRLFIRAEYAGREWFGWVNSDAVAKARKRNPAAVRSSPQYRSLARKVREFNGRGPNVLETFTPERIAELGGPVGEPALAVLGIIDKLEYTAIDWRGRELQPFSHTFKKASRPLLAYTHDGRLYILGGGYKVTGRGITDNAANPFDVT